MKEKETKPKRKQNRGENGQNVVVIPYIHKTSEQLAACFKKYGVTTALKPACTLRSMLVHPKDKISDDKKTGVVSKIPCKNCPKVYIG